MKMNPKKLVGAAAIAAALGMPAFVVGAGAANAATAAPPIAGPVQTVPVDWHGHGHGDCDWCQHGDWDGGWHGDWHGGGWGWGWRWGW